MVPRLAPVAALLTLVFSSSGCGHESAISSNDASLARNGDILFLNERDSRLYLMRPDGTRQRTITRAPRSLADSTWSPDGKRIVFTARTRGAVCAQLYVMQANGTRVRRLTHDGGCYEEPAWSPDGSRLVFDRNRGAGKPSLWTISVDGTDLRQLTRPTGYSFDMSPTWSPDGTTIAFTHVVGDPNAIWLIDADGSNARQLTKPRDDGGDDHPDWSPDGQWIAFSRSDDPTEGRGGTRFRHDIWLVRPDGTEPRKLTRHAGANWSPRWSPDGKRIVFVSDRKHSDLQDVYVMNADGGQQTRLTKGAISGYSLDWRAASSP